MRHTSTLASLALATLVAAAGSACTGQIADGSGSAGDDDGDGSGRPDGGDEFGGGDAQVCDQTTPIMVTQTQATPDVLLVVDKSGSMGENLGAGGQKMNVMKQALAQVLPAQQQNIHFGLMLYPSDDECGPGSVVEPIQPMNATDVINKINPVQPNGATPTHLSITAAGAYYAGIPVNPDGRYVLLATDGLPNCNGSPNNPSVAQSIAAIAALNAAGIKTFVIGFGDVAAADPNTLQQMAMAGGTANFYPANSPAQLEQALQAISGTVVQASCSFALQGVPPDPNKITVNINGQPVPRDPSHQTGWDYDPATNSITFYGDTCSAIQMGGNGGTVGVDYGCEGPVIG